MGASMMSNNLEKDFNDEVYEDSFYGEEEELTDEEEKEEKDEDVSSEEVDDVEEVKFDLSFACDDCDYRWDDVIVRRQGEFEEGEDVDVACPMCGSMNVTQI
jgi:rubrerythrin